MTSRKHLKRKVRERSAKTGESYATALRHLRTRSKEEPAMSVPGSRPVLATCSFCNKSDTQVKKLIAGPGVYICDECVLLCDEIISTETTPDEAASQRAKFLDRSPEELLRLLPQMAATASAVEADLRRWVERVLASGGTWEQVARSLSSSVESTRVRFEVRSEH